MGNKLNLVKCILYLTNYNDKAAELFRRIPHFYRQLLPGKKSQEIKKGFN